MKDISSIILFVFVVIELQFDDAEVAIESILDQPYFFAFAFEKDLYLLIDIVDKIHV